MIQKLNEALQLLKKLTNKRVRVYDGWYSETKDYLIDQIRLEAASGTVTGFSGGQKVFTMTTMQFSQYAADGKVSTYYEIDHCSIRKDYFRID